MSELKADKTFVFGEECEAYKKSEADKVIAKLKNENERLKKQSSCTFSDDCLRVRQLKADYKEACDRLQTANLIKDEQLAATRYQKYKRCLSMVRCCMADNHTLSQVTLNETTNHLQWLFSENFFVKWAARWSRIADKFNDKETK